MDTKNKTIDGEDKPTLDAAGVLEVVLKALAVRTRRESEAETEARIAVYDKQRAEERVADLESALRRLNESHTSETSRLRYALGLANSRLTVIGGVPVEVPKRATESTIDKTTGLW